MSDTRLSRLNSPRAEIVRGEVLNRFFERFVNYRGPIQSLHVVSPWITNWRSSQTSLAQVANKIRERRIQTYIVTRPPELPSQHEATEILSRLRTVEVVYVNSLHAKYYVCESVPSPFALIASANLTAGSNANWEIGLIFDGRGELEATVRQLMDVTQDLRSEGRRRPTP